MLVDVCFKHNKESGFFIQAECLFLFFLRKCFLNNGYVNVLTDWRCAKCLRVYGRIDEGAEAYYKLLCLLYFIIIIFYHYFFLVLGTNNNLALLNLGFLALQ